MGVGSLFPLCGFQGTNQIVSLRGRHLYPLSHLTSPPLGFQSMIMDEVPHTRDLEHLRGRTWLLSQSPRDRDRWAWHRRRQKEKQGLPEEGEEGCVCCLSHLFAQILDMKFK